MWRSPLVQEKYPEEKTCDKRSITNYSNIKNNNENNNNIYILKQPNNDELCGRCGEVSETIQHITAACEQLVSIEYIKIYQWTSQNYPSETGRSSRNN